jgi:hypothetical protein
MKITPKFLEIMGVVSFQDQNMQCLFIKDVAGITDMIVFNIHASWLCVFVREINDAKAVRRSDSQTDSGSMAIIHFLKNRTKPLSHKEVVIGKFLRR